METPRDAALKRHNAEPRWAPSRFPAQMP